MEDSEDIVVGDGEVSYDFKIEENYAAAAASSIDDNERINRTMAKASELFSEMGDISSAISDPKKMEEMFNKIKDDDEVVELAGPGIREKFDSKRAAEKICEISKNPEKLEKMFSQMNEMSPEDKFHQKNQQQMRSKGAAVSMAPKSRAEILKMKKQYEDAKRNAPKPEERNYKLKKAVLLKRNGKFKTVDINVDNNMKAVGMFIRCEKISMFTFSHKGEKFLIYYNGEDMTHNKKASQFFSKKIGGDVLLLTLNEENVIAEFFAEE